MTQMPISMFERRSRRRAPDNPLPVLDAIEIEWSPATLQALLARELPGAQVIVVSNREPYIHNHSENGPVLQIPASGLVTALEPVMRACGGTWVAHGSGTADRETADADGRIRVPIDAPAYTLRRVWLSDEEVDGYYYGFANEALWPLCHNAFVRPTFRQTDWDTYVDVNRRFAEAAVAEATTEDPIVLVQDYHFALVPKFRREHLPKATILTFWHIPWPNAETFGTCPWKEAIVEGLLGSTVIGFHTRSHCNNFLETVDRYIESRIDREQSTVSFGSFETTVKPYPISIEWPPTVLAGQDSMRACRHKVRERLALRADTHLAVGIERFDYTKGIPERMEAVDAFLTRWPEWNGRFCLYLAIAPTRTKLAAYQELQSRVVALAENINGRHKMDGAVPAIILAIRHHEPPEVFELFRAADTCLVTSLQDGMNLVAKEFVASRDDALGVLILSEFAGASRDLAEALIVNPYDAQGTAEAIQRAVTMPAFEQSERMRSMRRQVRVRNVFRWAGEMLFDLARLRKRQRIDDLAELTVAGDG